jgi:hypothetical protein
MSDSQSKQIRGDTTNIAVSLTEYGHVITWRWRSSAPTASASGFPQRLSLKIVACLMRLSMGQEATSGLSILIVVNPPPIRRLADIDTIKTGYPYCAGCEVHKGFYESWLAVQPAVMQVRV